MHRFLLVLALFLFTGCVEEAGAPGREVVADPRDPEEDVVTDPMLQDHLDIALDAIDMLEALKNVSP